MYKKKKYKYKLIQKNTNTNFYQKKYKYKYEGGKQMFPVAPLERRRLKCKYNSSYNCKYKYKLIQKMNTN